MLSQRRKSHVHSAIKPIAPAPILSPSVAAPTAPHPLASAEGPAENLAGGLSVFAKPFELLLEQIQRDYGQFSLTDSRKADSQDVIDKQFLVLRWYVHKGQSTQAILLAREWIISILCVAESKDYLNKSERSIIENQLGKLIKPEGEDSGSILKHVVSAQRLQAVWSKLTEFRNDIAHAQMRPTRISANKLQKWERNIQVSWLEETLSAPDRCLPLADSHGNTHYLKQMPDFGDRWLRVIVNPNVAPKRIITLFFDRGIK